MISYQKVKVCESYVVTLLDDTFVFEWYMARFVVKSGYQEDMCHEGIGLCVQSMATNLGSIVDTIRMDGFL